MVAITTFGGLKEAILRWLLRDSSDLVVTDEQLTTYIVLCEAEINREMRVRELEDLEALATVEGQNYIDLPADFRQIISLEFNSRPFDIEYLSRRMMKEKTVAQVGRPQAFTIIGNRIYFDRAPDAIYDMELIYFRSVVPLDDTNTTNSLITKYPDLYLNCSLKNALTQLLDKDRLEIIAPVYGTIVERIKEEDKNSRMMEGTRMMPSNSRVIG